MPRGEFARSGREGRRLPVDDLPGWTDFITTLLGKTLGRVYHWEVWNEPPNFTEDWVTKTWDFDDPQFVGKWGYNFAFDSDSTQHSQYSIRSVTVTKL
ncbi:hypothetical protein [Nannocystis pusilla]|uniref:hypothetical protein n=1 Tax=Nannocystis pusilla TaxID=889268 RepID=UPI003DA2A60A